MTQREPVPSRSAIDERPIRSVKEFVKRYFPSAKECPHCNGTGMQRGEPFKYRDTARKGQR